MCSPRFAASQAVVQAQRPAAACNFGLLEQAVGQLDVLARNNVNSQPADALLAGTAVADVISSAAWHLRRTRLASLLERGGGVSHVAWESPGGGPGEREGGEWSADEGPGGSEPVSGRDERYLDLRFDDGVYVRVPRRLSLFDAQVSFEIGCLRSTALASGGFQGPLARGLGGFGWTSGPQPAPPQGTPATATTPGDDGAKRGAPPTGGMHRLTARGDMGTGVLHTLSHQVWTDA